MFSAWGNPPGGASRHPPLHKGGVFALAGCVDLDKESVAVPTRDHPARIAPRPLPGDGLSHPEQYGKQRIPTGDRNGSGGTPLPPGD